jgi:GTP-binding protein
MPQTKFVLTKALARDLKPIVVMNKIDRETAVPEKVENDILELFLSLDATDRQMEYSLLYASAKEGYCSDDPTSRSGSVIPLLDKIISDIPPPNVDVDKPFSMLVTQIEDDPFLGKLYLGKIYSGTIKVGDPIHSLNTDGKVASTAKCSKIIVRNGMEQKYVDQASAGEIISIAGMSKSFVNHTICSPSVKESLPHVSVDQPTISMSFYVNDSPVAGREGILFINPIINLFLNTNH